MNGPAVVTIVLLLISNSFMTLAWYGHLYKWYPAWIGHWGIPGIVLFSWGLAFFEYLFMVPANKMGFGEGIGPYNLVQLKVLQEVISLSVFTIFALLVFKTGGLAWNHYLAMVLMAAATYFVFYK
jgi:uncharacterized protein